MRHQMPDFVRYDQSFLGGRADLCRANRTALLVEERFRSLQRRVGWFEKSRFEVEMRDGMRDQAFRLLRIGSFAHKLHMELDGKVPDGLK